MVRVVLTPLSMRKSKLTPDEMQAAEIADDKRKYHRGMGFSLMDVRDRGWAELDNGARIEWPVDSPLEELTPRRVIPNGHFVISMGKESALFRGDDFQKFLRWVG